jgi:hypothetical protein
MINTRPKREVDRAQAWSGPELATADDCDEREEVLSTHRGISYQYPF